MKRLLLVLLAAALIIGSSIAAPQPKQKRINIAELATYNGMAMKHKPCGKGLLTLSSCGTITGEFSDLNVPKGEFVVADGKLVINGDISMEIYKKKKYTWDDYRFDPKLIQLIKKNKKYKCLKIKIENGKINSHPIYNHATMSYDKGIYELSANVMYLYQLPSEYYDYLKIFAGATKYTMKSDGNVSIRKGSSDNRFSWSTKDCTTYTDIIFENGTKAHYVVSSGRSQWSRSNGDFIDFKDDNSKYKINSYKLTIGNSVLEYNEAANNSSGTITHTFENGNKYVGTIKDYTSVIPHKVEQLVSFKSLTCTWDNFKPLIKDGTITYADGKVEKYIGGITEAEYLEAERKAREEAERIAEEKRAKEEAERIAREKRAKEEAEREEAERLAEERRFKQKVALLKKKYAARYVNAIVNGEWVDDMPFNLFKEYYGADALKSTGYGRDSGLLFVFYDLEIDGRTHSLTFCNNKLVL